MKPKVVILCGGLGTRLKEETDYKPKPMVNIGNRPILWHIMKIYASFGFTDFILCLGYKGESIKDYFLNYNSYTSDCTISFGKNTKISYHSPDSLDGWTIALIDTGKESQKGARLKKIEPLIDSNDFFVTYGDGLADINIKEQLKFHESHGKIGTVTGVYPPSLFGELFEEQNKVISFEEKPQTSKGLINGGFFVFNRKIFSYLCSEESCDLEHGPLETLVSEEELMVYIHEGQWTCMDTPRDMKYLNDLWKYNQSFWKVWD